MKKNKISAADQAYEYGLTASASIAIILLSFSGALSMPLWLMLICSTTSALEYQVFRDHIRGAREKLANQDELVAEIERSIARRVLQNFLAKQPEIKFKARTQSIANEPELVEHLRALLFTEGSQNIDALTVTINTNAANTEEEATQNNYSISSDTLFNEISSLQDDLKNELSRRKTYLMLAKPLSAMAGLSCGLVFLYSAHYGAAEISFYFGVGLSTIALSSIIFPMALMVAAAYAYLTYHSVTDMITDSELKTAVNKIRHYMSTKYEKGEYAKLGFTALGVTTLLLLAIGASIALGGTWWSAAKKGCKMVPHLASGAIYLRDTIIPLVAFSELAFNIRNGLITFQMALNYFTKPKDPKAKSYLERTAIKLDKLRARESAAQFYNPFRMIAQILETPFHIGFFTAHATGVSFSQNKIGHFTRWPITVVSGGAEAASELHMFFGGENHNHEEGGCDHDHGNALGWLFGFSFIGLHLLTATWAWTAGQCSSNKEHQISFSTAFQNSFWNTWSKKEPCADTCCTIPQAFKAPRKGDGNQTAMLCAPSAAWTPSTTPV